MWQELIREDEPIEVVFVSEDSSPEELLTYMREGHGDWLAVQHGANLGRYLQSIFLLPLRSISLKLTLIHHKDAKKSLS